MRIILIAALLAVVFAYGVESRESTRLETPKARNL
jgi:hypothetical protein